MKDINLLPEKKGEPDVDETRTMGKSSKIIIIILVLVTLVLLYVVPFIWIGIKKASITLTKNELASDKFVNVKKMKADISNLDSKIALKKEVINDIEKNNFPFSEIMLSLEKALPVNCSISFIEYNNGKIKVGGIAESAVAAGEFAANFGRLSSYSGLKSVIDYKTTDAKNSSWITFDLTFALKGKEGK